MANMKKRNVVDEFISWLGLTGLFAAIAYPDIYLRKNGVEHPQADEIFLCSAAVIITLLLLYSCIVTKLFGKKPSKGKNTGNGFLRTFIYLSFTDLIEGRSAGIAQMAVQGSRTADAAVKDILLLWIVALVIVIIFTYTWDYFVKRMKSTPIEQSKPFTSNL